MNSVDGISEMIMDLRIYNHNSKKNIAIINPYAPHMGYEIDISNNYWYGINKHFGNISN